VLDRKRFPEKTPLFDRIARQAGEEPHSAYTILERFIGKRLNSYIFLWLPFVLLFSYAAGAGSARKETVFRVSDSGNLLLIRRYGQSFALRKLSDDLASVSDPVVLWSPEEFATHSFHRVEIKSLTVEGGRLAPDQHDTGPGNMDNPKH
jgi:hypothetical protein